jgi:hypothetical protein
MIRRYKLNIACETRHRDGCDGNTETVPAEIEFENFKWIELASLYFLPMLLYISFISVLLWLFGALF